jgi:SAM-dependent methyltransferase
LGEKQAVVAARVRDSIRFGLQLLDGSREKHEQYLADNRHKDIAPYLEGNQLLRVLDLANGHLRPQYILLKAAGHRVYGIDVVNRPELSWVAIAYWVARWLYAKKLGAGASNRGDTLVCGNVAHLPYVENSFDLVTSVAAFEHFYDVPSVVAEIHRVTRPGGLVWVWIHPFPSLSGGHNLSLTEVPLRTIPPGIDPWDHLRRRRLPFHVPLNEWRIAQYIEIFISHFHILKHYCALREGVEHLTPEIKNELSQYSRDELTCGGYVILGRKDDVRVGASARK